MYVRLFFAVSHEFENTMSIHIDSEDYRTPGGSRSNGIWDLSKTVSGVYHVISQTVEVQDFPWIWSLVNELVLSISGNEYGITVIDVNALPTYQYSTNKTTIAAYLNTRIDAIGDIVLPNYNSTFVYDSTTDEFVCTFDTTVTLLWSDSSCRGVFNKLIAEETGTIFRLDASYITNAPKYLYAFIEEATSSYITTKTFSPTLMFATDGNEMTGQEVIFKKGTKTLTISIYLVNITYLAVTLTAGWEVLLNPN